MQTSTSAPAGPRGAADRRRFPRRAIPGIEATLRSPGDVTVFDLSLTGLAAEVSGEVQPGEHCFLELRHQRDRAIVETVVKWSSVTRAERDVGRLILKYRAGMAFVDIDRETEGGIWDCILTEGEA